MTTAPKKQHGGARKGAGRPRKTRVATGTGSANAEAYLTAVIAGTEAPDPVRVRAATALIRYQQAMQRAPIASPPPKQMAAKAKRVAESAIADEFAKRAAAIRAKHASKNEESTS